LRQRLGTRETSLRTGRRVEALLNPLVAVTKAKQ